MNRQSQPPPQFSEAELTNPFALFSRPEIHADPFPAYRALREFQPVLPDGNGMWFLTSHQAVSEAFNSKQTSTQVSKALIGFPVADDLWTEYYDHELLFTDADRHAYLRRWANSAFKPRRVRGHRAELEAHVDDLLAEAAPQGTMDVTRFAQQVTLTLLMRMVGLPQEDFDQILAWSTATGQMLDPLRSFDPAYREPAIAATEALIEYLQVLMHKRRVDPLDDVISNLVQPNNEGESLSDKDVLGLVIRSVINAGHVTTTNQIGNDLLALLQHPDQLELYVTDPAIASKAVEELFRFEGTGQVTVRVADEDIEIAGTTIPEGNVMWLLEGAANRDPAVFEEPDRLDLSRDAGRSLASGGGIHYCLGASLSRLECEVALAKMLDRYANIELLTPVDELPRDGNLTLRGVSELPISFSA